MRILQEFIRQRPSLESNKCYLIFHLPAGREATHSWLCRHRRDFSGHSELSDHTGCICCRWDCTASKHRENTKHPDNLDSLVDFILPWKELPPGSGTYFSASLWRPTCPSRCRSAQCNIWEKYLAREDQHSVLVAVRIMMLQPDSYLCFDLSTFVLISRGIWTKQWDQIRQIYSISKIYIYTYKLNFIKR